MDKYLFSLHYPEKKEIMLEAVFLARKGEGYTAPNPCVGALLTRNAQIVAKSWHKYYGRKHAEVGVLEQAGQIGVDLGECSLWVTLEPCNHTGHTPPCTRAIFESGIDHVIVGVRDPNPGVAGGGVDYLRAQGVKVDEGIAAPQCRELIRDFTNWHIEQRPYVYLKLASTLDGKIGTRHRQPLAISGTESRKEVHRLRNRVQAVLVGGNTFYADNPSLTARLSKEENKQPWAIVLTSRLPEACQNWDLVNERPRELIFWTSRQNTQVDKKRELKDKGVQVWEFRDSNTGFDFKSALQRIYTELNCYYLLCEGGGRLGMSLFEQGLVDKFFLILNPRILGDEKAIDLFSGSRKEELQNSLDILRHEIVGDDIWITLVPSN